MRRSSALDERSEPPSLDFSAVLLIALALMIVAWFAADVWFH